MYLIIINSLRTDPKENTTSLLFTDRCLATGELILNIPTNWHTHKQTFAFIYIYIEEDSIYRIRHCSMIITVANVCHSHSFDIKLLSNILKISRCDNILIKLIKKQMDWIQYTDYISTMKIFILYKNILRYFTHWTATEVLKCSNVREL
jgi:hypothetical protein